MSLEKVYANVNVNPREKRFSIFAWNASYSESATLSRKRATFVNRGKARNSCCCVMVFCPSEEEAGISPKYGFGIFFVSAAPKARSAAGNWLRLDSGRPKCVFFDPR